MPHELPLIATLAVGLGLAFAAGFGVARLGLPPLVGYLLAGIVIGPHTPGFVADAAIAGEFAEIGVILLMFGVGTHFSLRDLWEVRRIALPGAVVQIAVATGLSMLVAMAWGWTWGGALVFGLALSVASTVVMLRALQDRGLIDSVNGRIAVGWLVVEDLVMVLTLILLPAFAGFLGGTPSQVPGASDTLTMTVLLTFLKIGLFFVLMYAIGMRLFPWLSRELIRGGSRELITIFVTVLAISMAYGAAVWFGVSLALGAFLAGVVVNEAGLSKRFAAQAEVLEHVFAVLFFVSVGMLFDPGILFEQPLQVLMTVAIIMVGKSLAAFGIVMLFRHPLNTALTVSASLAQIGEFSFILASMGVALGLMPPEGRDLILAGALLSITLNPLTFRGIPWIEGVLQALRRAPATPPVIEPVAPPLPGGHAVLIGYGRVGRIIGKTMAKAALPFLVIDQNPDIVEKLRKRGWAVVQGDASSPALLRRCRLEEAGLVLIAIPNTTEARRIFDLVRAAYPDIAVVVRTHDETQQTYFMEHGADLAPMAEQEVAQVMSLRVLERLRPPEADAITPAGFVRADGAAAPARSEPVER
ncbi:MAG TPA: cation:proton antiporter [Solimonas sp.]